MIVMVVAITILLLLLMMMMSVTTMTVMMMMIMAAKMVLTSCHVSCALQDNVRSSIKALVESMWAPDPADRPTFQVIVNKLQVLLKQTPPEAVEAPCCNIQ